MEEININKYLSDIPSHKLGRIRYNPVNMLKTVLFGFMDEGYISLRKLEDKCRVKFRYQDFLWKILYFAVLFSSFYRKSFLMKYILKDSFFQKVLKYCSICVTKVL
jgi:hypothetical protein